MTWYLSNLSHLITMPSVRDPTSSSPHFSCSEHQTSLGTFPFASNPEGHEQGSYGYGQIPSGIDAYGYNLNGLPQHPGVQYSNEYNNFSPSQYGHRDYVWVGPNGYNCQPGYHCDEIDKHKRYLQEKPQDKLERSMRKRRAPTVAQRRAANIRERRRMYNLNEAFDCLRRRIPTFAYEKRLSRIETLRLAISYISFMTGIVNGEDPSTLRVDSYDSSLSSEGGSMVPLCAFSAEDNNDVLDEVDNDEENPKDTEDEPSITTEEATDTHDEQFGCLCDIEL